MAMHPSSFVVSSAAGQLSSARFVSAWGSIQCVVDSLDWWCRQAVHPQPGTAYLAFPPSKIDPLETRCDASVPPTHYSESANNYQVSLEISLLARWEWLGRALMQTPGDMPPARGVFSSSLAIAIPSHPSPRGT